MSKTGSADYFSSEIHKWYPVIAILSSLTETESSQYVMGVIIWWRFTLLKLEGCHILGYGWINPAAFIESVWLSLSSSNVHSLMTAMVKGMLMNRAIASFGETGAH